MANVQTVLLGGEERAVKLSVAAFQYAKKHGSSVSLHDLRLGDIGVLAQLLWIGLLPEDLNLTEAQVLEWLMELTEEQEMDALAVVGHALQRFVEASSRLSDAIAAGTEAPTE